MKIAAFADVHLGNHRRLGGPVRSGMNQRCLRSVETLRQAISMGISSGAERIIGLGDLFDTCDPPPQLIKAVQDAHALRTARGETVPANHILGNHDRVSLSLSDHALGPLDPVVSVHERPTVVAEAGENGSQILMVPFSPGPAFGYIRGACDDWRQDFHRTGPCTLCIHAGIDTPTTPPWLKGAHDSITLADLDRLCVEYGIGLVLAGNWHEHGTWDLPDSGALVVQASALVPTGWDNPGLEHYGKLIVVDDRNPRVSLKVIDIPGPRFIEVSSLSEAEHAMKQGGGLHYYYINVRLPPAAKLSASQIIRDLTQPHVACTVTFDTEAEVLQAREAASVTRTAASMVEAVERYVEKMPLPGGVSRANVLKRMKEFTE